ncbi:MAG TPA: TolC family protein [Rhodocyclaceae bacterium]
MANAKSWKAAALAAALLLAAPAFAGAPLGSNVDELLAYAREHNPDYTAVRAEAAAAAERVQPAGALADPILRTELMDVTNYGTDASPNVLPGRVGSTKYTLLQPLPFWGKRDLKRDAAQAEADAAQGRSGVAWNDIAAGIKTTYAQYFALSRLIDLNREVIDLIGRIEEISRNRYANGLVPQQDAIRAQVERTSLRSELVAMETEHHHAMSRLNALLARRADAPLAVPQRLRPIPDAARLDYTALAERLEKQNPQLFAADAGIRAAEKNRDLAYRNRWPDFTVGVAPTQTRTRVNDWGLMVEFNIPLQQESRRSQEREAERNVDAARARKEASANQLLSALSENLAAIESAGRIAALSQDSLLPQARLTFDAALAAYENGKVDFATLLDAQRQIRVARQNVIRAQADQQARLADIERLIGEDL